MAIVKGTNSGSAARQAVVDAKELLKTRLRGRIKTFSGASGTKSRRAYLPIPPSQIVEVLGGDMMTEVVWETCQHLGGNPANRPQIGYLDVRNFLAEEINAAYFFLGQRSCDEPIFQQSSENAGPAAFNQAPDVATTPCLVQAPAGQFVCPAQFWNEYFCGRQLALAIRARSLNRISSLRSST